TIFGILTNNGTINGNVSGGAASGPGDDFGLAVSGDLVLGPSASLLMPSSQLSVRVEGNYDVAINNNANYNMAQAELRMIRLGGLPQSLEVMSLDIGPDPAGLDRTLPGHYPIGTLRIGPTRTTVNMADVHDNDGLGQVMCEAIYVENLIIESGATLNTLGCPVYYVNLTKNGTVDDPANLIALPPPPSTADISGPLGPGFPDGCVDAFDLGTLLGAWCSSASDPDPPGDVDPPCEGCTSPNFALADISGVANVADGCVDAFDLAKLLAEWCSVAGGNPCGTCF
ncbi:MAG: hypothetical protein O6941_02495, partial [Planctomycetota bacterium]|nr:hypothetical protein [Planctomycetota bacterium]